MDEKLFIDWIAKGLEKGGKSRSGLAKALGIAHPQISQLMKGERRLKVNEVSRIAAYLEEPLPVGGQPAPVPLVGFVGAGAEAHYYGAGQQLDEFVDAPDGATPDTRALEIRGTSLGELFDRWLVFYDDVRSPVTSDLIGRLCVVGLPDDRVLVKKLTKSRSPGLFHLLSNTEAPILDAEVAWAARVKNMVPR